MKNNVTFQIFAWSMGVILILFGWVFTAMASLDAKVNTAAVAEASVNTQLAQIQTDLYWIKLQLGFKPK